MHPIYPCISHNMYYLTKGVLSHKVCFHYWLEPVTNRLHADYYSIRSKLCYLTFFTPNFTVTYNLKQREYEISPLNIGVGTS